MCVRAPLLGGAASRVRLVIIPLVTVALATWLGDEPINPSLVVGGLLVVVGVYIGALRPAHAVAREAT